MLLLGILMVAVALFFLEWLSVDVVTLFLLAALVLFGILSPAEAFSGFASEIVVILASIFVLSGALVKSGVMDWLGKAIYRLGGTSETKALIYVMILSALISAFLSNTTATAILLPAVLGLSRRNQMSPARMLIPLAFASILGGTCTLIGTSTNLAASGLIHRMGMQPFSLFEFAKVGLIIVLTGIVYMALSGYRLLPRTRTESLAEEYHIRAYLSEVFIPQGSSLKGQTLQETSLSEMGITVLAIVRKNRKVYPEASSRLREEDVLIVQASRESLLQIEESADLTIRASGKLDDKDLIDETIKIVEAIVMPQSTLIGKTLKGLNFRRRFGILALAVYRRGHAFATKVANLSLRVGDVLLLEGQPERFEFLQGKQDLWVLAEVERVPFRKRKGTYALVALLLAVILGGMELVPLSIAFLLAGLAVIVLKCISVEEVYSFIEWRLIILIGGMTSFGLAMDKTQTADYLARVIVDWTLPFGLYFVLAAFVALTMLLTQPMSNAAAALVMLPLALSTASQLQVNPRTLAILITLSASLSFIAPLEPACLLVYGPGRYRFRDFVVFGFPLTVMTFAILMLLVPMMWPLR